MAYPRSWCRVLAALLWMSGGAAVPVGCDSGRPGGDAAAIQPVGSAAPVAAAGAGGATGQQPSGNTGVVGPTGSPGQQLLAQGREIAGRLRSGATTPERLTAEERAVLQKIAAYERERKRRD